MTETPDLYATLGVSRDAPQGDIRRAYRRAAKGAHPDHGGAPERWAIVQLAHDVLTDDDRRQAYDETGDTAEPQRDTRMSKAVELISAALDQVLHGAAQQHDSVTRIDVVERLRGVMQGWETGARQKLAEIDAAVGTHAAMRGRFRTSGDSNLMELLIAHREDGLVQMRKRIEANMDAARFALTLLEHFVYRSDPVPRQYRTVMGGNGYVAGNSGTGGWW